MNSNLPKIKLLMLWAKGNFLFQGLVHTTLFLKLPSALAPAPGSLYCHFPAKGSMKTKPVLASQISLSIHTSLHFMVYALKANCHFAFAKTPTI